ncbi:hypothetical protein [Aeoliella sp.]|uniref:hypothetical protein n=1 Tax=Aeoliella sp. TaxID=2795800 RepID=UPI003CCB8524
MSHLIDLIEADTPVKEIILAINSMTKVDLEAAAKNLNDNHVTRLGSWTVKSLRSAGVETRLHQGGLLLFYLLATKQDGRTGLFDNVCQELGIATNQAYDRIRVFEYWSKSLLAEPELMQWFRTVSLRLLAMERVPQSARDEAIEIARSGELVDEKRAKELIGKYVDDVEQEPVPVTPRKKAAAKNVRAPGRKRRGPPAKEVFRHTEEDTRVIIESANPKAKTNPALYIPILERALAAYRNLCDVAGPDLEDLNLV